MWKAAEHHSRKDGEMLTIKAQSYCTQQATCQIYREDECLEMVQN